MTSELHDGHEGDRCPELGQVGPDRPLFRTGLGRTQLSSFLAHLALKAIHDSVPIAAQLGYVALPRNMVDKVKAYWVANY